MPTRKITNSVTPAAPKPTCQHPDHRPQIEGIEPGNYVHVCEGCGYSVVFTVPSMQTVFEK